nr:hypothetical protein [Tanacetum cinerariifolium]
MIAILKKSDAAQGFEQIIDFLTVVKRSGDVTRLQALVDKQRIVISEEVVCEILQLNDAEGVDCLPNEEIFAGLARMGYEKLSTKLTFYKAFFSTQWKFFIHTILHSLSAKRTSWNEFSSAMASALICLSSGHRFNFSKYIFESLVHNVNSTLKFYMYPRVKKLEKLNKVKSSKLRRLKKVGTSQRIESSDDVENIVAAAALAVSTRRRKGVVIRDPEEELHIDTPAKTPTVKDKGKGILIEDPKPMKKKYQVEMDAEYSKETQYIKRYLGFKKKPQSESEARKNMISYLKNTEGFKMEFFKGQTYDQILQIFRARFDANMKFLFKKRKEIEKEDKEIIKSINETPVQKAAKRRKLSEEAQEVDDLRRRLEIVPEEDDDVFVEAIPLAQKVPVVEYQVVVIDNKPKYKIIRADDTHQFYISFTTLLKNFDREDLETL